MRLIFLQLLMGVITLQAAWLRDNTLEVVYDTAEQLSWIDNQQTQTQLTKWTDAQQFCANLVLNDGTAQWRLPSRTELLTLNDPNTTHPAIVNVFHFCASDYYWSADSFDVQNAWMVDFDDGSDGWGNKNADAYVRCVRNGKPVSFNTPPNAEDDTISTMKGSSVVFNILDNDTDAEMDTLQIIGYTQPTHGSLSAHGGGSFTYTPDSGYLGDDQFIYRISDGHGNENNATVFITVAPIDGVTAFIGRFYHNILGREADASGLAYWTDKIRTSSAAAVAFGFFNSPEYAALTLDDTAFVEMLYTTMYGRPSDAGGRQYWLNRLAAGATRENVIFNFFNAPEFASLSAQYGVTAIRHIDNVKAFVRRFYTLVLGRDPEPSGMTWWSEHILNRSETPASLAHGFFESNEYLGRNPADSAQFIADAYHAFFGRDADAGGITFWSNQMNTHGMSRSQVIDGFIASNEFQALIALFGLNSAPQHSASFGIEQNVCDQTALSGNLLYVSPQGSDTNADGSKTHPFHSVYYAVTQAQSGDTVVLRGGRYVESQEIRIRVPSVSIRSYPGEWAVIDRTSSGDPSVGDYDSGIYLDVDADDTLLECFEVEGGFYVVSTETRWDWGDPNDRGGPSGIELRNMKLHGSYADAVKIKPQSNDFTVSHCEIFNTGIGQDPNDCNAEGVDNVNADRTVVEYNYIHNTCSTGLYFKGGSVDCLAAYNLIEDSGEAGILLGFDTSPEYFSTDTNPDYFESIGAVAHHNLIRHAKGAGIGLFASKDSKVYNNTVIDSSSRFHAPLYFGITYQDWDANAVRPPNTNPSVHDNIFAQESLATAPIVSIRYSDDLGGISGLSGHASLERNCYFQSGGTAHFVDGRNGEWEGGFSEWKTHIGSDATSIEADPDFDADDHPQNPQCAGKGY